MTLFAPTVFFLHLLQALLAKSPEIIILTGLLPTGNCCTVLLSTDVRISRIWVGPCDTAIAAQAELFKLLAMRFVC